VTLENASKTPPFLIEDETDAKASLHALKIANLSLELPFARPCLHILILRQEDTRMTYRYLDIRRNPVKEKLILRAKMAQV
jgi:aspartyl-tRNA synthetase